MISNIELPKDAESASRESLHRHDLGAAAHSHLDRACPDVCESGIATREIGKGRAVLQLTRDLNIAERPMQTVRPEPLPEVLNFKMKV